MSDAVQPAPGEPSGELIEEQRQFWREIGKSLVRDSVEVCNSMAKQLITVSGILEGLYFHAIAFSDLRDKAKYPADILAQQLFWYLAPIALLLLSLVWALVVFFPAQSRLRYGSSKGAKRTFEGITMRKLWFVRLSAVFLICGVTMTLNAAWLYLTTRLP